MPTEFQDSIETESKTGQVNCRYTTGAAGTGKTYQLKQRIEADESEGILCATTGVAAVNLGTTTINSILGYFDTDSLADIFATGQLTRKLVSLRKTSGYRSLMLDEAPMLEAYALDLITEAAKKANIRLEELGMHLDIELTGDFAQLGPVKGEWAFKSSNWQSYADNMVRLEKIYRQTDVEFLNALNLARHGDGPGAAEGLRKLITWSSALDLNFPGTTIVDKNSKVDDINQARYLRIVGKEKVYRSRRWGKQRGEWKQIPDTLEIKSGTLVMILSNAYTDPVLTGSKELIYANGDSGTVVDMTDSGVVVQLARNGGIVHVPFIERAFESKEEPEESNTGVYFNEARKRWILGNITYLPVRLAYAVTVHKSQGLTLDKVQLDPRGGFFGSPNMAYVALSRVRTPQGLKIVGTPEMFAKRIKIDKEVVAWI